MPPVHPGEILLMEFLEPRFSLNLQSRYDLEIEKDRLGPVLDGIQPLTAAS